MSGAQGAQAVQPTQNGLVNRVSSWLGFGSTTQTATASTATAPAFQGNQTRQFGQARTSLTGDGLGTASTRQGAVQSTQTAPAIRQLGTAQVYHSTDTLTAAQQRAGFHMNRIELSLAGNSHFNNWWNFVQHDTSLVVVQGSAYKGQTVRVGGESYQDATVLYLQRSAGFRSRTHLDIAGKAGEDVRVVYYRLGSKVSGGQTQMDAAGKPVPNWSVNVSADGKDVTFNVGRPFAAIGGDPHFRDVKFSMQATNSASKLGTQRVTGQNARVVRYHNDHYGWGTAGDRASHMGGDSSDHKARAKQVDPMTPGGR